MNLFKKIKKTTTTFYWLVFIGFLFFLTGYLDAEAGRKPAIEYIREPYAMKNPTLPTPELLYGINVERDPGWWWHVFPEKEKLWHWEEQEVETRTSYWTRQFGDVEATSRENNGKIPIHWPQECVDCAVSYDVHRAIIKINDEEPPSLPDQYYAFKERHGGLVEIIWAYIYSYSAAYLLGYLGWFAYSYWRRHGGGGGHGHDRGL